MTSESWETQFNFLGLKIRHQKWNKKTGIGFENIYNFSFFTSQENLNYATYHDGMNLKFGQCVDVSFFFTPYEHSSCFWLASFQSHSTMYGTFYNRSRRKKMKTTKANVNVKTYFAEKDHKTTTTNRLKPAFSTNWKSTTARDFQLGVVMWWSLRCWRKKKRKKTSFHGPAMCKQVT